MTLTEAIRYVQQSLGETNLESVSPDTILDVACRIFNSHNISQSKKENIQTIKNNQPDFAKEADKSKTIQEKANSRLPPSISSPVQTDIPVSNAGKGLRESSLPSLSPSAPTMKQINELKRLGVKEIPTTKKEAWQIINQAREK